MRLAGLRKFKAQVGTGAALMAAMVALTVLSGCVVVPAYGPGYHRGYYAPGYYYRDRDDYYYRRY
ncbi:MAG: hypothetical protein ACREFI_07650 [Stellaceae bacterium]